jgi:hypothetical protein
MIRTAIPDDYQNASLEMADWSPPARISVPVVATYGFGQFKKAIADAARSRGKVLFTSMVIRLHVDLTRSHEGGIHG